MIKILRQLVFIGFVAFSTMSSAGKEGTESGGGGGIVYFNNQPHLVDFYTIQNSREILAHNFINQKSSIIESPHSVSFDHKSTIVDPAFKIVLEIFNKWSRLPYDTIGLWINTAIFKPVVWNFTNDNPIAPKLYRPLSLPDSFELKTAAYYLQKDTTFNVNISLKIWNQLSIQDQVGLIIHETLRHVQIGQSFGFDDEALAKATALLMTCKPRIKLDQYLFFLLNNRRDLAEQRFEAFEQLTNECWR